MSDSHAPSNPMAHRRRGRIADFDEHRGLGTIETDQGERLMFHCIELEDGTRCVETGAAVEFETRQKFSRPEAFAIRKL